MSGIILTEQSIIDGLYSINGHKIRGTNKPIGIATRLRFTNNKKWFEGSALYRLDPPIQLSEYGFITETNYVIVTNLPDTNKHNKATTIIAASGIGRLFRRFHDNDDYLSAEIGPRLIGKHDHKRVLSALQGGYCIDVSKTRQRGKYHKSRKS